MENWFLIGIGCICGVLAYDASKIGVPGRDVPVEVDLKGSTILAAMSLADRKRWKEWDLRFGVGDLSMFTWLWIVLTVACIGAGVWGLLGSA
jgi:hypothetical protein